VAIEAANVPTPYTSEDGVDLATRRDLGFLQRPLDGLDGCVDIDNDALAQGIVRRGGADTDDREALVVEFTNNSGHLRGSDIEPNEQFRLFSHDADEQLLTVTVPSPATPVPQISSQLHAHGLSSAAPGGGAMLHPQLDYDQFAEGHIHGGYPPRLSFPRREHPR
jgi:hypothetical protein